MTLPLNTTTSSFSTPVTRPHWHRQSQPLSFATDSSTAASAVKIENAPSLEQKARQEKIKAITEQARKSGPISQKLDRGSLLLNRIERMEKREEFLLAQLERANMQLAQQTRNLQIKEQELILMKRKWDEKQAMLTRISHLLHLLLKKTKEVNEIEQQLTAVMSQFIRSESHDSNRGTQNQNYSVSSHGMDQGGEYPRAISYGRKE